MSPTNTVMARELPRIPRAGKLCAVGAIEKCDCTGKPPWITRRMGLEVMVREPTFADAVICTTPDFVPALNVVNAWPELPEAIRAGILAMVDAAGPKGGER